MKKSSENSIKGIRVGKLFLLSMILSCVLSSLVFVVSVFSKIRYTSLIKYKSQYSQCNDILHELHIASSYYTDLTRIFAETQEPEYMAAYFDNSDTYKKRSDYISILDSIIPTGDLRQHIQIAEEIVKNLEEKELYSMRLVCDAINLDTILIPSRLLSIHIQNEDEVLPKNTKLEFAKNLVSDENYIFALMTLTENTTLIVNSILKNNIEFQIHEQFRIEHIFKLLIIFVCLLFIVAILVYVVFIHQVYIPVKKCMVNIKNGTKIQPCGSYEMKYIASAYNSLCDKNEVTASVLKHKAEHDPLTGLINREGFEQIKTALETTEEPIAYLIIDIDLFKEINDEYGHGIGDDVLRKISNLFMEQFRGSDYVARIGGDEFAIIMTKFGSSPVEIINSKIQRLNAMLQHNDDGLPAVSLSVGVAFSKKGYVRDLEGQADDALYMVKRGGRCNCSFYDDNY